MGKKKKKIEAEVNLTTIPSRQKPTCNQSSQIEWNEIPNATQTNSVTEINSNKSWQMKLKKKINLGVWNRIK